MNAVRRYAATGKPGPPPMYTGKTSGSIPRFTRPKMAYLIPSAGSIANAASLGPGPAKIPGPNPIRGYKYTCRAGSSKSYCRPSGSVMTVAPGEPNETDGVNVK